MVPIIIQALRNVTHPRFFRSERGFQGQFQTHLQIGGAVPANAIIEEEHQKTLVHHGITARPDIIIHIPTPRSGDRRLDNFAVFALKRRASRRDALSDFADLDDMVRVLHYQLAVFVNIDNQRTHAAGYAGACRDRIHFFSVWRDGDDTRVRHAHFTDGQLIEN